MHFTMCIFTVVHGIGITDIYERYSNLWKRVEGPLQKMMKWADKDNWIDERITISMMNKPPLRGTFFPILSSLKRKKEFQRQEKTG